MGHNYQAVGWNRQKRLIDLTLAGAVVGFLAVFVGVHQATNPNATPETAIFRAVGAAAFTLLHVILCIGPLCRLDRRFLPLLYNRRHLGVTMFFLALVHGGFYIVQHHALGNTFPLVSLFTAESQGSGLASFPFQPLGFFALAILFLMAATSHDFWLANLGAPVWKTLHMGVYLAYFLASAHVLLGAMQAETSMVFTAVFGVGMAIVLGLHLKAGLAERAQDREARSEAGWVDVCRVDEIPEKRARIACIAGDRVAVFRYDGLLSAVSNACQHQNGPLGEGRILDGCITCPWHGYQYRPEDGSSPPPFEERVPTFDVRVVDGRVQVHAEPHPAGTRVEPTPIPGHEAVPAAGRGA